MIPQLDTISVVHEIDTEVLQFFSKDIDMIPLTLVSGSIEELQECMDASTLERMLGARACTIMHVIRHQSGYLINQRRAIKIPQDFAGVFRSGSIPQAVNNTLYLILVRQG